MILISNFYHMAFDHAMTIYECFIMTMLEMFKIHIEIHVGNYHHV